MGFAKQMLAVGSVLPRWARLLSAGLVLVVLGVWASGARAASAPYFTALSGSMTTARYQAVAAPLPDGRVLIAGGNNSPSGVLSSAEVFDPSTGSFTALSGSMTTARNGAVATPLPDGRVLIAGGSNLSGVLSSAEVFDPSTGSFTALSGSMTTARYGAVAAPLPDGRVLITGGQKSSGILSSAEVFESAPEAAVAGGDFGGQAVGDPAAGQTLVVTNIGAQALQVIGETLGGPDLGDFAISADNCSGRRLAFEQSCTIQARFTPTTTGARTAQLTLTDNEPSTTSITLSGVGVAPNSGPAGPQGATGATGAQGAAGKILLVSCKTMTETVKRHGHKRKVHRRECRTRLITGTATFTATAARATLIRGRVIYATGTARLNLLVLDARRRVPAGRYTLILRRRDGRRWIVTRRTITIT